MSKIEGKNSKKGGKGARKKNNSSNDELEEIIE